MTIICHGLGLLFVYLALAPAPTYEVQPVVVRCQARP